MRKGCELIQYALDQTWLIQNIITMLPKISNNYFSLQLY